MEQHRVTTHTHKEAPRRCHRNRNPEGARADRRPEEAPTRRGRPQVATQAEPVGSHRAGRHHRCRHRHRGCRCRKRNCRCGQLYADGATIGQLRVIEEATLPNTTAFSVAVVGSVEAAEVSSAGPVEAQSLVLNPAGGGLPTTVLPFPDPAAPVAFILPPNNGATNDVLTNVGGISEWLPIPPFGAPVPQLTTITHSVEVTDTVVVNDFTRPGDTYARISIFGGGGGGSASAGGGAGLYSIIGPVGQFQINQIGVTLVSAGAAGAGGTLTGSGATGGSTTAYLNIGGTVPIAGTTYTALGGGGGGARSFSPEEIAGGGGGAGSLSAGGTGTFDPATGGAGAGGASGSGIPPGGNGGQSIPPGSAPNGIGVVGVTLPQIAGLVVSFTPGGGGGASPLGVGGSAKAPDSPTAVPGGTSNGGGASYGPGGMGLTTVFPTPGTNGGGGGAGGGINPSEYIPGAAGGAGGVIIDYGT